MLSSLTSLEQLLARLSLVGFLQRKQGRGFIIPSNSVLKTFAVLARDLEFCDRAPVPAFDFVQDLFDIFND